MPKNDYIVLKIKTDLIELNMKAVLCLQYGVPSSLVYEDSPMPIISAHQVLVKVAFCGVNFPDSLIIQNKYQFKPDLPFSPGGEVAGIVVAIGPEVRHLNVGDRVFALTGWGGFAEFVAVDAFKVFTLPPNIELSFAAAGMYTYGTSYHALKDRAKLQPGETLLVLGAAGGVGLAAVELAKNMGARVIAAASSDAKLAVCQSKGADFVINYQSQNLKDALKELDLKIDVVYDPVGDNYTETALRAIARGGRYLVVGFAAGEIPKIPLNLPLLKNCSIVGVFWGDFATKEPKQNHQNIMDLMQMAQDGKIKPTIYKTYTLDKAPIAIDDIMNRKMIGKGIVKI
jgi:NADPH:quinone reductase